MEVEISIQKLPVKKTFHDHDKDKCCGFYPNRYPYDADKRDCCRTTNAGVDAFEVVKQGDCVGHGGEVVQSVDGDPHNYFVLSSGK